jgi:ATP-dependent helicase HrpA
VFPLTQAAFSATLEQARSRLPGLVPQFSDWVSKILQQRQELLVYRRPYPTLRQDLDALLPPAFLRGIPFEQLQHVPRYLKAMMVRAERAALNPVKDQEKARQIQPYQDLLRRHHGAQYPDSATQKLWEEFRWLVEEFKVSCFAQELGTACPVSTRRLEKHLRELIQTMKT